MPFWKKATAVIFPVLALLLIGAGFFRMSSASDDVFFASVSGPVETAGGETVLLRRQDIPGGGYVWQLDYSSDAPIELIFCVPTEYDALTGGYLVLERVTLSAAQAGSASGSFAVDSAMYNGYVLFNTDAAATVGAFTLRSEGPVYRDAALTFAVAAALTVLLTAAALYWVLGSRGTPETALVAAGLGAVMLLASWLWFEGGYPYGDDVVFHLRRIQGLAESIGRGEFPQRVNTVFNTGYGYLNPVMYPELFLYIPAVLVRCGMSGLGAMRLFYGMINIATVLIAYISFGGIARSCRVGLLVSAVYTLAFYRLNNMYLRSALGEVLFMAFLPLALLGLWSVMYETRKRWWALALGVSCILQSHILGTVLSAMLLGALFAVMALDAAVQKRPFKPCIAALFKAVVTTVLLNFWFLAPFCYYYFRQNFLMFDREQMLGWFFGHQISLGELLSPTVVEKQIVFNMGPLLLAGAVLALGGCVYAAVKAKGKRILAIGMAVLICGFAVACTDLVPWELLVQNGLAATVMATVQFAFRFHGPLLAAVALALSVFPFHISRKGVLAAVAAGCCLLVVYNCYDFCTNTTAGAIGSKYVDFYYDGPNDYLSQGASYAGELNSGSLVTVGEGTELVSYSKEGSRVVLEYKKPAGTESYVKLPLFYYIGYRAVDENGVPVATGQNENGCIMCGLPADKTEGSIVVYFDAKSPVFLLPAAVSAAAAVGLAAVPLVRTCGKKKSAATADI